MKNISPQICTKVIPKKTHSSTFKILLIQPHIFPVRLKISIFLPREILVLCLLIETNVLWEEINKKNKLKMQMKTASTSQLIIFTLSLLFLLSTCFC